MTVSFLDQNLGRAYPFVVNDRARIPDSLVADLKITILQGSFDPAVHRFYLAWVARFGERIRLGIRTDAPDLADEELVFEFGPNARKFATLFSDSEARLDTVEQRCGCGEELICNPDFVTSDSNCDENVLCRPDFSSVCSPEQICNPRFQPNP